MAMQANPISIIAFLSGTASALTAIYAWQHRQVRGSKAFAIFMASLTVYVIAYSMELASLDLNTMLFWNKIEYLGICTFPTLFLIFVIQYTGKERWLTRRNLILLFLLPVIVLIAKWTDSAFHLVYTTAWVDPSGMIPLLAFTRGPLYLLGSYSAVPVSLGLILLWQNQLHVPKIYRARALLMMASTMIPLVVYIIYLVEYEPFPSLKYLDLNAFTYPLSGIWIAWAAFRYGLFKLTPVAREALIERLNDGVLVFDDQARLVDANGVAVKIMAWDQAPIGLKAGQVFTSWQELLHLYATSISDEVKAEVEHAQDGQNTFFDVSISSLYNRNGDAVGKLLVLHNITARKQLEARLLELSLVDELTGLSNRRGFLLLANQFLPMAKRIRMKAALVFLDLDDLKVINDTYGHTEGDRALVELATLLRISSRSSDIIARYSGDEFVILAIDSEADGAIAMLNRLSERIDELNARGGRKYPLSVSYGMAPYDYANPTSLEELIEQADKAMYALKASKKVKEKTV